MSRGLATLVAAQLAVGAAAIFARFALGGTGPVTASALRLAIAALVAVALYAVTGERRRFPARHEALFAAAGLALAVHFVTWLASLNYTSVAISTLLVATTPLWLGLVDAAVLRRPVPTPFWAALALAALGLAPVVADHSAAAPIPGHDALGIALALAGSAAIGVYLVIVREIGGSYPTRSIVVRTYSVAALALLAAAGVAREPWPVTTSSWGGILAMALVSQGLGHTGMNAALRTFTPRLVAASTLAEPVIAALLAWLIFGEQIGPAAIAGGAIILTAIAIAIRSEMPGPDPAAAP